jgi:hypothetical protein
MPPKKVVGGITTRSNHHSGASRIYSYIQQKVASSLIKAILEISSEANESLK